MGRLRRQKTPAPQPSDSSGHRSGNGELIQGDHAGGGGGEAGRQSQLFQPGVFEGDEPDLLFLYHREKNREGEESDSYD